MSSSELQLFHAMLQKLMAALSETIQMYEDYGRIHAGQNEEVDGHFARPLNVYKKEEPRRKLPSFNQSRYEQEMRRERLNREVEERGQVTLPKETLSCKQRIAALRSINKHVEKEQQSEKTDKHKEGKKNTAFFLYLQEKRISLAREYPELKPQELTRLISDNWKAMSEEERKPFYRENIQNRKEFDKNFQKCLSTVLKAQRTDPPHHQTDQQEQQKPDQEECEKDDSEWRE